MVESKLVELVVAGSNPVGHPIFITARSGSTPAAQLLKTNLVGRESSPNI